VLLLWIGLVCGAAIGAIAMAFLAAAAYDRGYADAARLRNERRRELEARRRAAHVVVRSAA
jgi:hypothetical protein